MNSFELLSHTIDDRVHIDKEYYYTKEEQCKWFVCTKDEHAALFRHFILWQFFIECSAASVSLGELCLCNNMEGMLIASCPAYVSGSELINYSG